GIEADGLRLAIDFRREALKFRVQHAAVAGESVRGRLRGQRAQAVQHLTDVVHAAIDDLQGADAVVGVANALRQFGRIAAVFVGNCQSRGIVARGVDAVAGSQPLNGLTLEVAVDAQVLLRDQGVYVRLNRKSHRE